jgi:hypothetical protein
MQLRLESFNTTNTPQFSNPNTGWGTNFGYITGTIAIGYWGSWYGRRLRGTVGRKGNLMITRKMRV